MTRDMSKEDLEELAKRIENAYPDLTVYRPKQMLSITVSRHLIGIRRSGEITTPARLGFETYPLLRDIMAWAEEFRDQHLVSGPHE